MRKQRARAIKDAACMAVDQGRPIWVGSSLKPSFYKKWRRYFRRYDYVSRMIRQSRA